MLPLVQDLISVRIGASVTIRLCVPLPKLPPITEFINILFGKRLSAVDKTPFMTLSTISLSS